MRCDAEAIKASIVDNNPEFELRAPQKAGARYKVLYYSPYITKVNIWLPGVMDYPALPLSRVVLSNASIGGQPVHLPLPPPELLLLFKLHAWSNRRKDHRSSFQLQANRDAADIEQMFKLDSVIRLRETRPWSDRDLFSANFEEESKERARAFCQSHPWTHVEWTNLGFQVPVPSGNHDLLRLMHTVVQ